MLPETKPNPQIKISIVMPVYNSAEYLDESIQSILNQSFPYFELIIINDGSTDNSVDIIKKYQDNRIRLISRPHNFIKSLNTGISLSQGKYIARMDADDIMLKERLQEQYEYMETHSEIDICGTWIEVFGKYQEITKSPTNHNDIITEMLIKCPIYHPTVIMRKERISKYKKYPNLYKQNYIHAEDYKLWVDLTVANYKFANIPKVLMKYRTSNSQITFRYKKDVFKKTRLIQEYYYNYICSHIIKSDNTYYNFINITIDLYNNGKLSKQTLQYNLLDAYMNTLHKKDLSVQKKNIDGKIKILFCIYNMSSGGAEKLLIDILQHFDYKKYHVDLLVLVTEGVYFQNIPEQVTWFSLSQQYKLLKNYDFEIAFLEGHSTKYIGTLNSSAIKIAWVHTDLLHNHWSKICFSSNKEEKDIYSKFNKIIFVSEASKQQFNKLFPTLQIEQKVIYNLIDRIDIIQKAEKSIIKKRKLTLCSIGRLTAEKGFEKLISIIYRLIKIDNLDFDYWIIGEGKLNSTLQSLIEKYSLNDCITLHGYQSNPYPFIKAADVIVSTSQVEGFSLVLAEAICLQKPILATSNTGSKELLENGEYGILVEQNENSIYQGLKKIITSSLLRETLSKQGLKKSFMFEPNQTIEEIYKLFEKE